MAQALQGSQQDTVVQNRHQRWCYSVKVQIWQKSSAPCSDQSGRNHPSSSRHCHPVLAAEHEARREVGLSVQEWDPGGSYWWYTSTCSWGVYVLLYILYIPLNPTLRSETNCAAHCTLVLVYFSGFHRGTSHRCNIQPVSGPPPKGGLERCTQQQECLDRWWW